MANNTVTQSRLGPVALGLAGIMAMADLIIGNTNIEYDLVGDPLKAAQHLSATNYQIWAGLMLAYYIAAIFGWVGLYLYLSKGRSANIAFWGMFFSIMGMVLLQPFEGVWNSAATISGQLYLQGHKEALTVYKAIEDSANLPAFLTLPVLCDGLALFCVAVWQDNTLPKAAMIVLTISILLLGPILPVLAAIIDGVILAGAGVWLAFSIGRKTGIDRSISEPASLTQLVTH